VRSVASAPFYMGDEPSHWQGGATYSWTTTPDGTRKRVKNPLPALPDDPSGKAKKGILAFAAMQHGEAAESNVRLIVLGGGSDARWEAFDLVKAEGGGSVLVKVGWRKYLTRQFVD